MPGPTIWLLALFTDKAFSFVTEVRFPKPSYSRFTGLYERRGRESRISRPRVS